MRVGNRRIKSFWPYSLIYLITIWSFFVFAIITQASPYYSPKAISPPSEFEVIAYVKASKDGCTVETNGAALEGMIRKDAAFTYFNFWIAKALMHDYSISQVKQILSYYSRDLHVARFAKRNGFYLMYRKTARGPPRILHYFLKENENQTECYVRVPPYGRGEVFVESLNEDTYEKIKNDVRVFFSPEGRCEEEIIDTIDSAEERIDAAIYSFTNQKIADALKRARERRIRVRVFLDKHNKKMGGALKTCGIEVIYDNKKDGLMHNKFMIADKNAVMTGSYNWTYPAEKQNRENLITLPYVGSFDDEFNRLIGRNKRVAGMDHAPPLGIKNLFSPKGGCEEEIIRIINKIRDEKIASPNLPRHIRIALYYFTNKKIADALFDARKNGVEIKILLDKSQEKHNYAIEKYLKGLEGRALGRNACPDSLWKEGGLSIRYHRIENVIMHNKFALIGNYTLTGSYNWTKGAEKNRENLIILPLVMEEYWDEFDRLWEDAGTRAVKYDKIIQYLPRRPPDGSFDITKVSEPYKGPPLFSEFKKGAPSFTDNKYDLMIAREDFLLYRVFDSRTGPEGENKTKFENGLWLAEGKYIRGPPGEIQKNLAIGDWNNAKCRGLVLVRKGAIFACGGVKGGKGTQIYIRNVSPKCDEVIYLTDTVEIWNGNNWVKRSPGIEGLLSRSY